VQQETLSGFRNSRIGGGGGGLRLWEVIILYYILYTLARHVGGVSTHVRNEKKIATWKLLCTNTLTHTYTEHVECDTYHKY